MITLEDVIEELLGEEIFDETDSVYSDVHRRMSVAIARRASIQFQVNDQCFTIHSMRAYYKIVKLHT